MPNQNQSVMNTNSHVKNFNTGFYVSDDSRQIPSAIEGVGNFRVMKEHLCSGGFQYCFVSTDVEKLFSFIETPVNLHVKFGFIDRDFGSKGSFNGLQLSMVDSFYKDTALLRHMVSLIGRSPASDEVPKEAKVSGVKSKSLHMYFELSRANLSKVMLFSKLLLEQESLFCNVSPEIDGDDVRQEVIFSLKGMVGALRKHYALHPVVDLEGEAATLYPGATRL